MSNPGSVLDYFLNGSGSTGSNPPYILDYFKSGAPALVLNPASTDPGATALAGAIPTPAAPLLSLGQGWGASASAVAPRAAQAENPWQSGPISTVPVQPVLLPQEPIQASNYPSVPQLTNIIYNETASQRPLPGGPSLDTVRDAIANTILNRKDDNVAGSVAPDTLSPNAMGSVLSGGLPSSNPNTANPNKPAADAWFSSFDAALQALDRTQRPPPGDPGSADFYNGRSNNSTDPNTGTNTHPHAPYPFVGTIGPYYSPGLDNYWAFFGKPGK